MHDVSSETLAAWTGLATTSRRLLETIESELKARGFPSLVWYDALLELEKSGSGLRPYDLRSRLLLPQYSTSRLLDRLAGEKLIVKDACPEDGRGQIVQITDKGKALRAKMWPVYSKALQIHLQDRLSPEKLAQMAELLRDLEN